MVKVFISHSWDDGEISKRLRDQLQADGAIVFIDYDKIRGGRSLPKKIGEGINWCDEFVLLWSRAASKSPWVEEEWTCAWMLRKLIVPCILDDTPLPPVLLRRARLNFRDFENGYRELLAALDMEPREERIAVSDGVRVGEEVRVEIEEPNGLHLELDPVEAEIGTIVRAMVSVKGNARAIKAFGLDMSYNPSMFKYVRTNARSLTKNWGAVDGAEMRKGEARIGGFAGAGQAIPKYSDKRFF